MTRRLWIWVLGVAMLSLWACSPKKTAENTPSTPAELPQFETSDTVTAQVHVLAVDKANRLATLKGEMGDTLIVEVGPEVKNFDQLAAGDVIDVVYAEQLTVRVEPAGELTSSAEATLSTAKPGEKPAAAYGERTETKASITAIDKANGTATLTTQDGHAVVVRPRFPENLDKVKVGDLVVFTHTQELALSVSPVKKAP